MATALGLGPITLATRPEVIGFGSSGAPASSVANTASGSAAALTRPLLTLLAGSNTLPTFLTVLEVFLGNLNCPQYPLTGQRGHYAPG